MMVKTGIAVFSYNRSEHLKKVLDGLYKNDGVVNLYIFQDGLKCEADREEWTKTKEIIEQIDWCETQVYFAKENKGLSRSIVDGINVVLEENEAVIVFEDDCIPQPAFMSFITQCFQKYKDDKRVYSISGYSWPITLEKGKEDIYFCGRPCPWGWGTWKDRWEDYRQDYNVIKNLKSNKKTSRNLAIWGDDLENMLVSNIKGIADSWYVFWSLLLIEKGCYAINPYKSLVQNIGFDGSGVHCGSTDRFYVDELNICERDHIFMLRDDITVDEKVESAFLDLYGSYAVVSNSLSDTRILVYGTGNYYKRFAREINGKYEIVAFVDRYKKDKYYAGIDVIHPRQIAEQEFDYIYIMLENEETCNMVKDELMEKYGVLGRKIIIGKNVLEQRNI